MQNNEKTTFGQWRKNEDERKKINEASWFGLIVGLAITVIFGLRAIISSGIVQLLFVFFTAIGMYLFVMGGFFPTSIMSVTEKFKKITNIIGKYVLRILLIPVYLIMLIISVFFKKSTSKKYEFYKWDSEEDSPKPQFIEYEETQIKQHSSAILGTLNRIFFVFAKNKLLFLVPLVVILLVLGLVFFFLSSSSVFGFVYTLF
ncbi:MAG: hypothetical protein IJS17_07010 [Clostridia bacterium]|nr:hypothetical protein [Clostridia bacterium]